MIKRKIFYKSGPCSLAVLDRGLATPWTYFLHLSGFCHATNGNDNTGQTVTQMTVPNTAFVLQYVPN